ncbi:ABC transporter substrate-binding protein [Demequina mangrovi]|uniref:Peptide/nickel transport system substrate-binding protein n=1 Tax=Demequina mangrovi TaxID=1043493 RepID=A0A1H6US57_9MICO|nr:ABC transporter substrate-binding protein [Demequina mangrovi]SEI93534.1 peptide/nickel transport system substrate-binding protein [Demequina mangrovi]
MRISGISAAVAAGTMLVLATGCTARDTVESPSDGASSGASAGAAPVDASPLVAALPAATTDVDEVTWALVEGEPRSLLPGADYNFVAPNLCDSLLQVQPDFSIEPGIATSAEWVDPVTFVIDLRDGVTFWDGTPVTTDDVIYSLERHRQDVTSAYYGAFVLVAAIEATGDQQVTVSFTAPDSTFRDALAGGAGAVLSKAYGGEAGDALGTSGGGLLCAGPFELDSWTPGKEIVTVANEGYWGGAPHVKTLTYRFVSDGTTLTNALVEGEIDGAFNVPPASRSVFEGSDAGTLVVGPSTASFSFGPTRSTGAGANPLIRQALSMAIDRDQYIATVLNGLGQPQRTFVAPFSWASMEAAGVYQAGYDALAEPTVDLEAAKALVAESGEDTSVPLVIAIPAGSKELSQTAAIIQSAGQQIGLTIEIDERQPADFAGIFLADPGPRESIDFVATTGYTETPGVLAYPQLFLLPAELGGIFNWSGYADPEVIGALQAARTTPDPTEAAGAYVAAQEIFAPDLLQVTLAGAYHTTFLSSDLTGATTSVAAYASPWAQHLGGA